MQAHLVRAAEVKKAIEWIMCNLDGHYAADSVSAAIAIGAVAAESAQESDSQVSSLVSYNTPQKNSTKVPLPQGKGIDLNSSSSMSKNFRYTDSLSLSPSTSFRSLLIYEFCFLQS